MHSLKSPARFVSLKADRASTSERKCVFYEPVIDASIRIACSELSCLCRLRPASQKIFLGTRNSNSHQNSHLTKTKKATSRVASVNL